MARQMWPCESCHSVNAPKAARCYSCHLARGASPSFEPGPDDNGASDASPAGQIGRRARTAAILGAMAVTSAVAIAGAALAVSLVSVVLVESPALPAGEVAGPIFAPPAPPATVAPEPVPTTTPMRSPEPSVASFADIRLNGKGKKVEEFTIPEGSAAIAEITHEGESNFIVHTLDASGDSIDRLVNEIGDYSGTVLLEPPDDQQPVAFEIDADGAWTITVKPVALAKAWDLSTTLTGTGDSVHRLVPPSAGPVTLELTYNGERNFIVQSYSDDGSEGLANEIGEFTARSCCRTAHSCSRSRPVTAHGPRHPARHLWVKGRPASGRLRSGCVHPAGLAHARSITEADRRRAGTPSHERVVAPARERPTPPTPWAPNMHPDDQLS